MARIAGVDLPDEKRIDIGLTSIYGLGRNNVMAILEQVKIKPEKRVKTLTAEEIRRLQALVDKLPTEGALRQKVSEDIKRLKTIGSYRGSRHSHNLPARGQQTRTNARTKRGKRQTIGALKKKELAGREAPAKQEGEEAKTEK